MSPYRFLELDDLTRSKMLEEFERDLAQDRTAAVTGKTLTEAGRADYDELCREALSHGSERDLIASLASKDRVVNPPVDAERLAATEFNRYYIRGVCRRAQEHGTNLVIVYRARESVNPRPQSLALEGQPRPAQVLLANLRERQGDDVEVGVGKVLSGSTVRCGCDACLAVDHG